MSNSELACSLASFPWFLGPSPELWDVPKITFLFPVVYHLQSQMSDDSKASLLVSFKSLTFPQFHWHKAIGNTELLVKCWDKLKKYIIETKICILKLNISVLQSPCHGKSPTSCSFPLTGHPAMLLRFSLPTSCLPSCQLPIKSNLLLAFEKKQSKWGPECFLAYLKLLKVVFCVLCFLFLKRYRILIFNIILDMFQAKLSKKQATYLLCVYFLHSQNKRYIFWT